MLPKKWVTLRTSGNFFQGHHNRALPPPWNKNYFVCNPGYDDTKVENIFKEAINQKMGSTAEFIFRFSLLYLLFIIQ